MIANEDVKYLKVIKAWMLTLLKIPINAYTKIENIRNCLTKSDKIFNAEVYL